MIDRRYEPATVLLYDPQATMRHNTRVALLGVGFGSVEAVATAEEFLTKASEKKYDLIMADTKGPDGLIAAVVQRIRHNEIGSNPFTNIMITTWDTSPEVVRASIRSGVDDLVGRPMSTQQIADRVSGLVSDRKPFVVAEKYIGPDRRHMVRLGPASNTLIVPNSLKAKVEDKPELDATPGNLKLALAAVNERKISIYTERFLELSKRDMSLTGGLEDLEKRRGLALEMIEMNKDLIRRLEGSELKDLLPLAVALDQLLDRVAGSPTELSEQDRGLMYQIPFALHKATEQARFSADMVFDIEKLSQEIRKRPKGAAGFPE